MDFFETVKTRYSYREKYKDIDVPKADMDKILEAACRSQSGYNQQTTEMIVVTDKNIIKELGDIYDYDSIRTAPLNIVLVSNKVVADGLCFEVQDYTIVAEHICLAATALGYATVFTDGITQVDGRDKEISKLLEIPESKTVRATLPVGIAETPGKQAPKKGIDELVHFNKY